jgi:predicted metal-dependent hydrolase
MAESKPSEIFLEGRAIPYRIRRNPRARRVLLKVEDDLGFVVVLPRWFAARDVQALIVKHAAWVLKAVDRRAARLASFHGGGDGHPWVLFRGERLPFRFLAGPAHMAPRIETRGAELVLSAPRPPESTAVSALLDEWYRGEASRQIPGRVAHWALITGLHPRRLTLGDARSRWGSCSHRGAVTLSWRLILAPPEVLDYLIVHELCHIRHPNHSAAYWASVASRLPDYARERAWLRHNGAALHAPPVPAVRPEPRARPKVQILPFGEDRLTDGDL